MKIQLGLFVFLAFAVSVSSEVVFEDFDGYAPGPVTNNPGWTVSSILTASPAW